MPMEERDEGDVIAWLERENEEYRRLKAHHHEFEEKLQALAKKRILTDQEKLEEVRMKKQKLFLKDRMAAIQREYATSGTS